MIQAEPYIFTSVPGDQVELANRLFRKNPGLSFQLGRDTFRVDLKAETTPVSIKDCRTVDVRMDDHTGFELGLEDELLLHLAARVMPYEEMLRLPEDIRAVVLEVSLEKILDPIDRYCGGRSSIREARGPERKDLNCSLLLTLTRQNDGYRSISRIRTDAHGMAWLAARLERLPHKIDHCLDRLPLAGRIEAGRVVLSLNEISDLSPFDIVLAEGSFNQDLPDVFIRFGGRCTLAATLVQPRKILIQDLRSDEMECFGMTPKARQKPGQPGPPTGDIPIEVVFEIGTIHVPLAKLMQLQPGFTFQPEVPIDPFKPVTIRANGMAVGRGEIIRIEDRLGIRILAFDNPLTSGQ